MQVDKDPNYLRILYGLCEFKGAAVPMYDQSTTFPAVATLFQESAKSHGGYSTPAQESCVVLHRVSEQ
jgi:hypothetical protein